MKTNFCKSYKGFKDVAYEIVEHLGVLSEHPSGWKKEVNIVKWNEGEPKYDIRDWDSEHEKMTRGITLKEDEFKKLIELKV